MAARCCKKPRLRWRGEERNAEIVCDACGFSLEDDGQLTDWHDPEQIAEEMFDLWDRMKTINACTGDAPEEITV